MKRRVVDYSTAVLFPISLTRNIYVHEGFVCLASVISPWAKAPIALSAPPIKKRTSQSVSNQISKERDDMAS